MEQFDHIDAAETEKLRSIPNTAIIVVDQGMVKVFTD